MGQPLQESHTGSTLTIQMAWPLGGAILAEPSHLDGSGLASMALLEWLKHWHGSDSAYMPLLEWLSHPDDSG